MFVLIITFFHTSFGAVDTHFVFSLSFFYRSEQVKNNMLILTQIVKDLPAIRETWVQSLDQKDSLEKGMATHSSILAWRIPWTEEPGGP